MIYSFPTSLQIHLVSSSCTIAEVVLPLQINKLQPELSEPFKDF